MLVQGVMTTAVITVRDDASIGEARKIMEKHRLKRFPVVDQTGRPVGLITQSRLQQVMPKPGTPLVWQMRYLLSHTRVRDVMRHGVVTVKPGDTIEKVVAVAQASKVGTVVVLDDTGKLAGIVATNDIFYRVVNPTLGIGQPGTRIVIGCGGERQAVGQITAMLDRLGVDLHVIWSSQSSTGDCKDITVQIDGAHEPVVCEELAKLGFEYQVRQR